MESVNAKIAAVIMPVSWILITWASSVKLVLFGTIDLLFSLHRVCFHPTKPNGEPGNGSMPSMGMGKWIHVQWQRGWLILIPTLKIKLMLLARYWHIGHRGWRILFPDDDQVILFPHEDNCIQGIFHMPPWPKKIPLGLAWIRNFPATQNCLCYVTMMGLGER